MPPDARPAEQRASEPGAPGPCWVDGVLREREAAALPATDSAFSWGLGCYTTARWLGGAVLFGERHAARLARDARRLGLGGLEPERVVEGLTETGRAAFGTGEGVVRIQASRDGEGRLHLTAVPRHVGPEPATWRAGTCPFAHEGVMPWSGSKVSNHLLFALASDWAREQGLDEALLVDRDGHVVEGARSNLLRVDADGSISTPDPARGGVAGVGLEWLRERAPEIRLRHLAAHALEGASELVAVNAIRGPRPVVELDGAPVGDGRPGAVARRLRALFDAERSQPAS